jgi:hypothetical protein
MQHAKNGGEKEIGSYKVDGYYENENGQQYVLEFNGKFRYTLDLAGIVSSSWFVGIDHPWSYH